MRVGGATLTVEQAGAQPCSYTINPTYYNAGRGPDDVKIDVRSTGECPWSAMSSASWVSVTEGATGMGNGSVRLRVQANSGEPRTTTLTIAGEPFTLSQEGACQATLKPTYYNAGAGPDDVRVQVKASNDCAWTSSSPVPWAIITEGAAQSGNANVRIRVDANPGAAAECDPHHRRRAVHADARGFEKVARGANQETNRLSAPLKSGERCPTPHVGLAVAVSDGEATL